MKIEHRRNLFTSVSWTSFILIGYVTKYNFWFLFAF